MKKSVIFVVSILILTGFSGFANATLITIGEASYNGLKNLSDQSDVKNGKYKLIWDNDNNGKSLIWLDFTIRAKNWNDMKAFAFQLNTSGVLSYSFNPGYSVDFKNNIWRLPLTVDDSFQMFLDDFNKNLPLDYNYSGFYSYGFNNTKSELGHLFYEELKNAGRIAKNGQFITDANLYGLKGKGDFTNLIVDGYWSETVPAMDGTSAWKFDMETGFQGTDKKYNAYYGIAALVGEVTYTQIPSVPEPTTMMLFGFGLLGLAGVSRKKN